MLDCTGEGMLKNIKFFFCVCVRMKPLRMFFASHPVSAMLAGDSSSLECCISVSVYTEEPAYEGSRGDLRVSL